MKYTEDQIADAAERACFYVTPDGKTLRILFCDMDAGEFQCLDEDTGNEYCVRFSDLVDDEDPQFLELTPLEFKPAKETV